MRGHSPTFSSFSVCFSINSVAFSSAFEPSAFVTSTSFSKPLVTIVPQIPRSNAPAPEASAKADP